MRHVAWIMVLALAVTLMAGCKDEEARKTAAEAKQVAEEARETALEAMRIANEAKTAAENQMAAGAPMARSLEDLAAGEPDLQQGQDVYTRFCAFCHGAGIAGSPVIGDSEDWGKRATKGMETLLEHGIDGIGHMPPRGGEPGLTDEEVRDAIAYMLKESE